MRSINKFEFIWLCYHHLLDNASIKKTGYEFLSKQTPTADLIVDFLESNQDKDLETALNILHKINEEERDDFLSSFDESIRNSENPEIVKSYLSAKTKKDFRYIAYHVEYFKNSLIWEEENKQSKHSPLASGTSTVTDFTIIGLEKYDDLWYALFKTDSGDQYFCKSTSRFLSGCKIGERIKLKYRIKDKIILNGVKQTIISNIRRKGLW